MLCPWRKNRRTYASKSISKRKCPASQTWSPQSLGGAMARATATTNQGARSLLRFPKGEAHAIMAQILQPLNGDAGLQQHRSLRSSNMSEMYSYRLIVRSGRNPQIAASEPDIVRYLIPAFGDAVDVQDHPAANAEVPRTVGKRLSASVVGHLRWHLNAIFRMAVSDGVISFNPANALFIPECKASPEKRIMSKDEVLTAFSVLDLRERLILRMAFLRECVRVKSSRCGLARLQKLRSLSMNGLTKTSSTRPKVAKERTLRDRSRSPGTAKDLDLWRSFLPDQSETAFLFPSEAVTTPLRPNNHWKRKIRPRLEQFGLGWVNFQMLRRTNASLSRKAKVDDKVSADQRGHGLGVSLGVYAISDLDQKIEAVTKLESAVIDAENDDDFEFVASGKRQSKTGKKTKVQ